MRSQQIPVKHNCSNMHAKEKSTVRDMIKNHYEKPKKQRGPKKSIWIRSAEVQAINCSTQGKESRNNSIKNQE